MTNEPTWAQLVRAEPRLGALLSEVRAYRGGTPDELMWWPGGVHERLVSLLAAMDWRDGFALMLAIETAMGVLWRALPARGESMSHGTGGSYDAAGHRAELNSDFLQLADDFWHIAQTAPAGQAISADVCAALADVCAAIAADQGESDTDPALGWAEVARARLRRALDART